MNDTGSFFTMDEAAHLAGLPAATIGQWIRSGVLVPAQDDPTKWLRYRYFFSFRDLVTLRTLRSLRDRKIPLGEIRRAAIYLKKNYDAPWAELRFWIIGKEIVFAEPGGSGFISASKHGQYVAAEIVKLEPLAEEMDGKVTDLYKRPADQRGQVRRSPNIMSNQMVVAGTRITTNAIWEFHRSGASTDEILEAYPSLFPEDIDTAVTYEASRRRPKSHPSSKIA